MKFHCCFKPYYKWITFNTREEISLSGTATAISFKPYYKWITFNTAMSASSFPSSVPEVLNLIINGLPSILNK